MTKHLHRDIDLTFNENTLKSLYNISSLSKKVCISGEGDPLAEWKSILKIIDNGPENQHYELITSSYWNESRTLQLIQKLSNSCLKKHSRLAYRISIDKFHAEETARDILSILLNIFSTNKFNNVSLQIRSLTGQENYLFHRIKEYFEGHKITYEICQTSKIEYEVYSKVSTIKIQFKPSVFPSKFNYNDSWNITNYINYLENKRQTEFHIGHLKYSEENPVYDITINPNGDVVLYGAESFIIGNIEEEVLNCKTIRERVNSTPSLKHLVSKRFIHHIEEWNEVEETKKLIESVNNPFWVVRNLSKNNLLKLNT